jgi:hypothetical protein
VFDGLGYILSESVRWLVNYLAIWWAGLFVCLLVGWLWEFLSSLKLNLD